MDPYSKDSFLQFWVGGKFDCNFCDFDFERVQRYCDELVSISNGYNFIR